MLQHIERLRTSLEDEIASLTLAAAVSVPSVREELLKKAETLTADLVRLERAFPGV